VGHPGGTIKLAIPKLREGSYFPELLLERRGRSEKGLISVVATSYLLWGSAAGSSVHGRTGWDD
jgi:transposase-like protein